MWFKKKEKIKRFINYYEVHINLVANYAGCRFSSEEYKDAKIEAEKYRDMVVSKVKKGKLFSLKSYNGIVFINPINVVSIYIEYTQ